MKRTVSVIIAAFNAEQFLPETIDSIRRQEYRDWEVLVVDDLSTDGSCDLLRRMSDVRLLERGENSGAASVPRNEGINASQGQYIAIFDADDVMEAGKLAAQVAYLDANRNVDLVFTDFVNFDERGLGAPHTKECKAFRALLPGGEVGHNSFTLDPMRAYRTLIDENFIGCSSMMFRRTLIHKIGGFDPQLTIGEDVDFVFRAAAAGSIGFVDMIGHRRRLHSANMTSDSRRMLTCYVALLEKELQRTEDVVARRLFRRRLSEVYFALGYSAREAGELDASLGMLGNAIRSDWRNVAAYRSAAKALLYYVGMPRSNPEPPQK